MTLQENFNKHSKEYIFSDNKLLTKDRETLFNKIHSNDFEKRNNESLKNIDFSDLSKFKYYYQPTKNHSSVKIIKKNIYQINLTHGNCMNYEDDNIEIRGILSPDFHTFKDIDYTELNDVVIDLNTIFLNSGIFVHVKKNSKVKLQFLYESAEQNTIFQKNFFNFEKNCEVIIEDFFKLTEKTINNIQNIIKANYGAKINHNIFQNFSNTNKLYLTSNTICEKNSSYIQNTYNFADGFVRNFHYAKLNGEFSKAELKGCFFLNDNNTCSNKTYINHNAENCSSDQTYKGILNDNSKANYFSNTFVSDIAQKTEGYQLSKGILLTDKCSFFSKPELRIFADDVKCSHGSTIGPVDESALYYLRSRGINKKQAMKMIISSFIQDDLKYLDAKNIDIINQQLSIYLENI